VLNLKLFIGEGAPDEVFIVFTQLFLLPSRKSLSITETLFILKVIRLQSSTD